MTEAAVDDAVNHRFALEAGGQESELVYRRNGRRLVLVHTGVPEALAGRGIGGPPGSPSDRRARSVEEAWHG